MTEQLRDQQPPRILRLRDVRLQTGLSTSTIYQAMRDGAFPRSIPLSGSARGWLEAEISDWIRARVAERDTRAS